MLSFPNKSRVFDPARCAVLFWGHDGLMEWSFSVTEEALKKLCPAMGADEVSVLDAFDANRKAIYAAAMKAYKQRRKRPCQLGVAEF
jgi:hypothetical protein